MGNSFSRTSAKTVRSIQGGTETNSIQLKIYLNKRSTNPPTDPPFWYLVRSKGRGFLRFWGILGFLFLLSAVSTRLGSLFTKLSLSSLQCSIIQPNKKLLLNKWIISMLGGFLSNCHNVALSHFNLIFGYVRSSRNSNLCSFVHPICLSLTRALNPHVSGSDLLAARSILSKKLWRSLSSYIFQPP